MQFIKNKTTHITKCLLTSSVLILNGNIGCDSNMSRKSNQSSLKPTTPYSSMGHKPKTREDFIQKVQQLKAATLAVSNGCDQLIKDYNESPDSLDNDATSPMPSMDDTANDSGYESENSYDVIPSAPFNSSQKNASFTYPLPLQHSRYAQPYKEPWDKFNHRSTQTEPTHQEPTQIVNATKEPIYDEVPQENIYEEIVHKAKQPIYGKVPNEDNKEEPIYEKIKENNQAINPDHAKQTKSNYRPTPTYYKNGIPCTDL